MSGHAPAELPRLAAHTASSFAKNVRGE